MSIAGIIFIIGFTLQVSSMNYAMLVVARIICGLAIGLVGGIASPRYCTFFN